jgi:hypothetical protein
MWSVIAIAALLLATSRISDCRSSVDEATKTIVPKVEGSTFPNMVGTDQSRVVTSITADEMRFINPKAPAGVLEIVWKRAK